MELLTASEKKKKLMRIFIGVGSALMLLSYFFPLWRINIWAPQYPEGLMMQIWSQKMTGDITTINILNHYIGMAPIHEDSFKELVYFPIIFGILIGFGFLTSTLFFRIAMARIWCLSVVGFAIFSLYDFWKWEYEFGHNLSSDAPIKMDDMVYQPPLIGSKEFLNIQADSWPEIAGFAFAGSVFLAVVVFIISLNSKPKKAEVG